MAATAPPRPGAPLVDARLLPAGERLAAGRGLAADRTPGGCAFLDAHGVDGEAPHTARARAALAVGVSDA